MTKIPLSTNGCPRSIPMGNMAGWTDGGAGIENRSAPKLYQDNLSTIVAYTKRRKAFSKLAHFYRRFFCIKDQQDLGSFETKHCNTEKMKCNSLTKPGTIKRYQQEKDEYMTRKGTPQARGEEAAAELSNVADARGERVKKT